MHHPLTEANAGWYKLEGFRRDINEDKGPMFTTEKTKNTLSRVEFHVHISLNLLNLLIQLADDVAVLFSDDRILRSLELFHYSI
ncbi:hypothetical protein Tco_0008287 [Tanacetum coccineum]